MREHLEIFIDGRWVRPANQVRLTVDNPATGAVCGEVALGSAIDVDQAVAAARRAFDSFGQSSRAERIELLKTVMAEYERRADDLADAITEEMGAPSALARSAHVAGGLGHFATAVAVLENFHFEEIRGATRILREPIGVCALITPWNWPLNQIACKVAPALAVGCTMVLKPSELAPFSAQIFAEVMAAACTPAGVFNMIQGDGPSVGEALTRHPDIDMVSFTGSTRAGIEIARSAAGTVKRVCQELGGKSPYILLDDGSFAEGVARCVQYVMTNSGQSCNAPTRLLVPAGRMDEAARLAEEVVAGISVGDPTGSNQLGPVASKAQREKIHRLIEAGIDEGATLVIGGSGRPVGLDTGYFVQPTVFADVTSDMTIAREEIFGPVLSIIGYDGTDEAVRIANDTEFGLAAYVDGEDSAAVRDIASRLRVGQVSINGSYDMMAPFGGYKRSGNGREWGDFAFEEFCEIKALMGYELGVEG